uniref:Uncharacterized protein n=1 Tax=Rhizophora mucronata TaxID=61149 RepID=A0A2P2N1C9_RHIMU
MKNQISKLQGYRLDHKIVATGRPYKIRPICGT